MPTNDDDSVLGEFKSCLALFTLNFSQYTLRLTLSWFAMLSVADPYKLGGAWTQITGVHQGPTCDMKRQRQAKPVFLLFLAICPSSIKK